MALRNAAAGRTPAWGNNDLRPELQTIQGRFLRTILLQFIGGIWVFGLAGFIVLWILSISSILRWVVTRAETPVPQYVQLYLSFIVVYEGYHYVTRPSRHQWPWARQLMRYIFLHYPYFRLNVTVFEEKIKVEVDSKETLDLAVAACEAVEKNDVTAFVPPNDHALFAFHPHGVLSCGWSFGGVHHMSFENANCRWLVAENLFYFPIMRDLINWMEFTSAAKASVRKVLQTGQNLCLMPGGFEDATLYVRGKHRVYIKQRFGFIKLALQYGYKVHPVYTFGEEYAYYTFPYLLNFRLKLNEFKIPGTLFFGRLSAFHLPRTDVDLVTVVGAPLIFPKIEHPTREDVRKYHEEYVTALQKLFDRYKAVYAVDPEATLEIY
ncbi:diacylglycerol o [Plasmopara halstedii]|uniref:Acyltransferase n=1 Tax=Plasmopara halstedii TaxID=4781 RepID=A0A0P1A9P2_PLAHL|nr:diacylglycerol o [Plasmopara halstedii]CEG37257.1 diacylglycerol o [Plasmopara halstedii]|eukprot:XP_024573626.1 diacylglycerol o [Plasmopara halstedii]